MTMAAIKDFGIEELCEFFSSYDHAEEGVNNFRTSRISGSMFFELDAADLKELLPLLGEKN
jgi:hypothetical protein